MKKVSLLGFAAGCLAMAAGLAGEASAAERPYRYVPLDAAVPEGFTFFDPVAISDRRRVYGTLAACGPETCSPSVAVYFRGEINVLHEGFAVSANNNGRIGGGIVLDPAQGRTQAALFTKSTVKPIPPLSNDEFASAVRRLTDSRIALVDSFNSKFALSQYLTRRGRVLPLDFGPDPADHLAINDRGRISGTSRREDGHRAFRYNPIAGRLTLLDPLPTEPESWGQAINRRGDVLGYSFVPGGLERIGVWRRAKFNTLFVEGTDEFPTVSNSLLWNEQGLIVITDANDLNSYLVPRPGVRLNLADLTDGPLPVWTVILDINNRGDLIGVGGPSRNDFSSRFMLRRVGPLDDQGGAADSVASGSSRPAAAASRARAHPAFGLERIVHERLYDRPSKSTRWRSRSR